MLRTSIYALEAGIVYIIFFICAILPIDISSYMMGKLFQIIGPKLKVSMVAHKNLSLCLPHLSLQERKHIVANMWNNLGRIIGEAPHWQTMTKDQFHKRVTIKTFYHKDKNNLINGIFLSAHYGNWELFPRFLREIGLKLGLVYRPINNPFIDDMVIKSRLYNGMILIKKGVGGIRKIIEGLKSGYLIGMLVDQKTNNGIDIPFFSIPAKTTTSPANLALKFDIPIFLSRVIRTQGAQYIVELYPLEVSPHDDMISIMTTINAELERWIKEHPAQWFWVHRRWDKKYYTNSRL